MGYHFFAAASVARLTFTRAMNSLSVIILLLVSTKSFSQTMVISDNIDDTTGSASAVLELKSGTKGFLPPRMTKAQRDSIQNPAEGLLVYQTDSTKGIYYYKDSQWTNIQASSTESAQPIIKTANDTLDKTETIVFGSNNITLTLPAITAADDGLAITLKNIGSHTDLVTIKANGSSLIDSAASFPLPRWFSTTVVAKGGYWYYKQRTMFPVNTMQVSWHSPWQTIQEALDFLNMHMWGPTVIRLESGTFTIPATININLPYPLAIEGSSYGTTTIVPGSGLAGSPMFSCATECNFKMLEFDGTALSNYGNSAGEDAIRLTGTEKYHEIKDCGFNQFNKAICLQNNVELWLFDVDISNATAAGVEIAAGSASGVFFKVSETDFLDCEKGINLVSGTNSRVSIINCGIYNNSSTAIGINYIPATFTAIDAVLITGNTWNHIGTFASGFDFSRSDGRDKEIEISANIGEKNQNPHCRINVLNNTLSVSVSAWTKATWNTSVQTLHICKFSVATNRITYQPVSARDLVMWISGNLITSTGSNKTINVAIIKNGNSSDRYGETSIRTASQGQPYQFSTVVYLNDVKPGDYFEIWASIAGGGTETLTFQDINWFTNSQ